jgi:hypothetical protein
MQRQLDESKQEFDEMSKRAERLSGLELEQQREVCEFTGSVLNGVGQCAIDQQSQNTEREQLQQQAQELKVCGMRAVYLTLV